MVKLCNNIKDSMANFGSLWVGRPLSKLEQTCIASFVHHGHSFTLYVYDMSMRVPLGVLKKDARSILPEKSVFVVDNSYGPFADMFRYRMLQDTDLIWTDTDNICLRPDWPEQEYLFGMQGGSHELVAIGVLAAPRGSDLVSRLVNKSLSFNKNNIVWGEIGPQLLTKEIRRLGLQQYVLPPKAFYPVDYWDWETLWQKQNKKQVWNACKGSYTLQIWNQMRNRKGLDPDILPAGSIMEHFYNLYYKGSNED